ncbi:GntR family transcriptional regulator [Bosea sp. TND4EK4]|uniref:GntR family transcriptional regulator n=1 Tax=Bosea sp. TND4EK4 TaxID=1907408 RepID=UPI000955E6D7|nr:GntR family transcriptional regulator [Bosea sp. TND4EK4]SIR07892.1 DNA-binding transcriptional regulator, GntR family [Bosea sp. TND4EK4]
MTTRLQLDLAERIMDLIRSDGLGAGSRLNESDIARRLNVSRTPVRGALDHLASVGIAKRNPHRGIELVDLDPPLTAPAGDDDTIETAMVRLAHDRESGQLADEVSEQEVMRRYGLSRQPAQQLLRRLAELEMMERKPGYGWRFLAPPRDPRAHAERYRFRVLIEPMGFLEPDFALAESWIEAMRRDHRQTLSRPWREGSAIGFFEMNAAFHEGLAAGSGNRFIHSAVKRLNQLRRLSNYDWSFGYERVEVNCREHLAMLDAVQAGDLRQASVLMRSHLERASRLR